MRDPGAACRFWAAELDVAPARTHADYAALRAGGGAWLEFVRNSNPPKRQGRLHLRFEAPGRGKTGPRCPVCHGDSAELADGEGNRFCLAQMQEG
nr:VOC family protein [Mycobacterium sp. SMC-4]